MTPERKAEYHRTIDMLRRCAGGQKSAEPGPPADGIPWTEISGGRYRFEEDTLVVQIDHQAGGTLTAWWRPSIGAAPTLVRTWFEVRVKKQ